LPETLAGLHFLAFAMLMLKRFITFMAESAKQTLGDRLLAVESIDR
jgi:hypothetical protein